MPNIKQQKKRVGIASRQRLENLRYRSAIRTTFNKLEQHVDLDETDKAEKVYRDLVSLIDRAVKRKAIHQNNGARKKARASRMLVRGPAPKSTVVRKPKKKAPPKKKAAPKKAAADKKADDKKADKPKAAKKPAAKAKTADKADDAKAEKKPAAKAKAKTDDKKADEPKAEKKPAAKAKKADKPKSDAKAKDDKAAKSDDAGDSSEEE